MDYVKLFVPKGTEFTFKDFHHKTEKRYYTTIEINSSWGSIKELQKMALANISKQLAKDLGSIRYWKYIEWFGNPVRILEVKYGDEYC